MGELVAGSISVERELEEGGGLTLLAKRGGEQVGRLRVFEVSPTLWQLRVADAATPEVVTAFADYLDAMVPTAADVITRDTPKLAQGRHLLEVMGRTPVMKKAYVQRDLSDVTAPDVTGWRFRSMAEQSRDEFVQSLVACAAGDPFPSVDAADPQASLEEWIELAGSLFDPAGWFSVHDAVGVVGVVLPQVYWDLPEEGSLFYIGIAPGRRGQQLGVRLHRWGLVELRRRGAERYAGSTDLANAGMLGVFSRNGCATTHQQWYYRRTTPAEA